jgi:ribonuclease P protein component
VLAKENRVLSAGDFKTVVRRGKRAHTQHAVIYAVRRDASQPTRFGFIVAKSVGGAVKRNLVRRRLRAIARELLLVQPTGLDVVVRALPGVDQLGWDTLHKEISDAVRGSEVRR